MPRELPSRPVDNNENIGDVLASIRRLIAQDQADRPPSECIQEYLPPTFLHPTQMRAFSTPPLMLEQQDQILPHDRDEPAPVIAFADAASVADLDEPALTPEEKAEFAEAEAALARMVAPTRVAASRRPEPTDVGPAPGIDAGPDTSVAPPPNLFARSETGERALRNLIRELLQQELAGETGQHVSRQLHTLVRREVEAVLREICAAP